MQKAFGPLVMPSPIANFEGEYNEYGPIPPDTNGDVGSNHYIQIVNSGFTIFTKSGTVLYGPANNNTLFIGFGGICEATNAGDPVALYDPLADRWVLTWFTGESNPTHQCFAVSATPDPLGAWYRYDFISSPTTTAFEDYPHIGVWPDAYYMTSNEFGGPNNGGNYAFNRLKMLVGDPTAEMIYRGTADSGLLPSDLDGNTPPPAGSPNYIFGWYNTSPGQLVEYKFHADFANPPSSTLTGPFLINVPDFSYPVCSAGREQCVPQPGTTAHLEVIGDRLMYRVAYRNFGTYESLVLNHTVNATGSNPGVAAPRWYELRAPNGANGATLYQAGTYYPNDGIYRWMGSIAQDRAGDIAMGYSASSDTLYPSIRYAGRIPSDPLGTFGQGEATLYAGTGSEDFPSAPRWGDYSDLTVDPVDDCTFYYTQEYFSQTGLRDWRTRIGSFKFPGCAAQNTATPTATTTPPTVTRTPSPTATLCAGSITHTDSITNTDSLQTGRLGLSDPKSTCFVTKPVAALSDSLTRHYKSYTYTNSSGSAQCVTVNIVQDCGNNAVQSVTYLGSFNPNNIQANYLADGGASGHEFSYSFNLAAGQTAVIVVLEVSPNLGCDTYTVTVSPCAPTTPTATNTPNGGTATPTGTSVSTPTATTTCVGTTYLAIPSMGATEIPATNDIGNHCDDCNTTVNLPFPVLVYDTVFTSTNVGSNGLLDFGSNQPNIYTSNCLPVRSNAPNFTYTLFPYYDDLRTDVMTDTHGIYTATIGTAPHREFAIRWHTTYFADDSLDTNFEVVLHEDSNVLSVIYGQNATEDQGANPASGIQLNLGQYTSYSCHTDIPNGLRVDYSPIACGVTPSPTAGPPTSTPTRTITATPGGPTGTPIRYTPTVTQTPCVMNFTDVHTTDYFYNDVKCIYCLGAISGYSDGTFRPYATTTRGQMTKIIVLALRIPLYTPTAGSTFSDVPRGSTFFTYVETAAHNQIVSGYSDGTFRPDTQVTRGQLSKIDAVAANHAFGWQLLDPPTNTFSDVPRDNPFFTYIETVACHGVVSGYSDGTFRWGANAIRAQIAKIVCRTSQNPTNYCALTPSPVVMTPSPIVIK